MKVIVIGPRGKMGKLITQVAASRDDMELVGAIAPKGRDYIGKDLGTVAMTGFELGVPVTDDLESIIDSCDVIIDFSTKEMAMEVLDLAIAHKKALVCGSTGFSAEEMKRFEEAGKQIPMLYAANTSKLVNIMNKLLELVTATLKDEIDIEIPGGERLVATITSESTKTLELSVGAEVYALVKAPSVMVMSPNAQLRLSARNQLEGKVARLHPGAVNTEVVIELPGGAVITAIVTNESASNLGLDIGVAATAVFKASSVILGVPA